MILLIAQNKSVTECWQQVFKMAAFALDAQPGPFQRTDRKGGGGCPIIVTAHVHIQSVSLTSPVSRCVCTSRCQLEVTGKRNFQIQSPSAL